MERQTGESFVQHQTIRARHGDRLCQDVGQI